MTKYTMITFIIDPLVKKQLDAILQKTGITKSVYLRRLIEAQITKEILAEGRF